MIFYCLIGPEFERFLDENFSRWNSGMITPGYEFNKVHLRKIEGPLESNLSKDDLKNAGVITTTNEKTKKTGTFTIDHWFKSIFYDLIKKLIYL